MMLDMYKFSCISRCKNSTKISTSRKVGRASVSPEYGENNFVDGTIRSQGIGIFLTGPHSKKILQVHANQSELLN